MSQPGVSRTGMGLPGPAYRPNVGMVVINSEGLVWLGRRAHSSPPHNWQFPQGGIDAGEDLLAAALRELKEETGITSVSLLGRTQGWLSYDFPPDARRAKLAKGFRGQTQAWFAFRFEGVEPEIDLRLHGTPEFDTWRWARLEEAPDLVVPFKREVYLKVIESFAPYARPLGASP